MSIISVSKKLIETSCKELTENTSKTYQKLKEIDNLNNVDIALILNDYAFTFHKHITVIKTALKFLEESESLDNKKEIVL